MRALIIGGSGLVGKSIIQEILTSSEYESVLYLGRRLLDMEHPKLLQKIIDFENLKKDIKLFKGDILFLALGTTLKKAGSKEAQYRIDFNYQYEVAKICSENLVSKIVLISSTMANSKSQNFYLKMKGQLEDKILALNFSSTTIIRPGPLLGTREEFRLGERIGGSLLSVLPRRILPKSFRPSQGRNVAKTAVRSGLKDHGVLIIEAHEIIH